MPPLRSFLCLLVGLASPSPARRQQPPADLLLVNADIVTMDAAVPRATALAVRAGRIVALGSPASLAAFRGPGTELLDVGGRTVLPGFVDTHLHLLEYGQARILPSLARRSLAEVEAAVRALPRDGRMHRFWGWGDYAVAGRQYPTNERLNAWAADVPVVFDRGDGHVGLFNAAALASLDIERMARERGLPAETVERDDAGRPTGILLEEAYWAALEEMDRRQPPVERRRAVEVALADLSQAGVTSVRNILFTTPVLDVYRALLAEGRLTVRIDGAMLGRRPRSEKAALLRSLAGVDSTYLGISAAKYFADGAIGPGTGAMLEPYSYDSTRYGILHYATGAELARYVEDDLALGLQSMVHAMGDRAIRVALDAYAQVVADRGPGDYRFRIEHANMPTPEDLARWKRLPVGWSYQPPAWTTRYRAGRLRALGERRLAYTENVGPFLANRMPVAVGSDAPYYVDLRPLVNVQSLAAFHVHNDADPNVPVMQALAMVTIQAAYLNRQEHSRGSLQPGKLADFVVLSRNPLEVPPDSIGAIEVWRTVVGGRTVWRQ